MTFRHGNKRRVITARLAREQPKATEWGRIVDMITPDSMSCISGHRFHGWIFADGFCFALTEIAPGQWHVGNGVRGKTVSTLGAALAEFIGLMTSYGLDVRGTKRLWAMKIARAFRRYERGAL